MAQSKKFQNIEPFMEGIPDPLDNQQKQGELKQEAQLRFPQHSQPLQYPEALP